MIDCFACYWWVCIRIKLPLVGLVFCGLWMFCGWVLIFTFAWFALCCVGIWSGVPFDALLF